MKTRRSVAFCWASCILLALVAPRAAGQEQSATGEPGSTEQKSPRQLPETLFRELDRNRDGKIVQAEITDSYRARYTEALKAADRDGDGDITREEFNRARELPFYRDIRTVAVVLLIGAFAGFCLFLDGLLEPERREYFWWSLVGSLGLLGLSFLCARGWFFQERPFLGYVAAAPLLLILLAVLTGATREKEEAPAAPTGPVEYKVGAQPVRPSTQPAKPSEPARRPTPFQRRPRPAPVPRPPVPERRPQAPSGAQPPSSTPPSQPPRPAAQPPRPVVPPTPPAPAPPKPGESKRPPGKPPQK